VKAEFEYSPGQSGQPLLVLVVDGDYGNDNYMNVEISDIEVSKLSDGSGPNSGMFWIAGSLVLLISLMGSAFYIIRKPGSGSYYDEENDEDWDDDNDEEYE
jgi:hypothetical protein